MLVKYMWGFHGLYYEMSWFCIKKIFKNKTKQKKQASKQEGRVAKSHV